MPATGDAPLVTIGIVSYNRLHYLRALVSSALECIRYPRIQWVVVDGNSREPGLRSYVESLDFVEHRVFEDCGHADAMNRIVELAAADYVMILPEDVQFVVRGAWLSDLVEVVAANERIGTVTFDPPRRGTIERYFGRLSVKGRTLPLVNRRYRTYRTSSGREFIGFGRSLDGINGAGTGTFARTELWRRLGPWRTRPELTTMDDSGLGTEADMLERYRASGLALESVLMRIGVAADVLTDPRGTKARIRFGNRRYGRYAPPAGGSLYYEIWDERELEERVGHIRPAPGFEDIVRPIGFTLPLDEHGNLRKVSVIDDSEPYELVESAATGGG